MAGIASALGTRALTHLALMTSASAHLVGLTAAAATRAVTLPAIAGSAFGGTFAPAVVALAVGPVAPAGGSFVAETVVTTGSARALLPSAVVAIPIGTIATVLTLLTVRTIAALVALAVGTVTALVALLTVRTIAALVTLLTVRTIAALLAATVRTVTALVALLTVRTITALVALPTVRTIATTGGAVISRTVVPARPSRTLRPTAVITIAVRTIPTVPAALRACGITTAVATGLITTATLVVSAATGSLVPPAGAAIVLVLAPRAATALALAAVLGATPATTGAWTTTGTGPTAPSPGTVLPAAAGTVLTP